MQDKHYLALATALEFLGGILFLLGSDVGAKLLLLFLVPVTLIMHDFWRIPDASSMAYIHDMIQVRAPLRLHTPVCMDGVAGDG
jgi:uncharacterized membrane protein YphA (DoxX/SURF4 family)